MINSIPFDNDTYMHGITMDTVDDLRARRDHKELVNPHRLEYYVLFLVTEGNGYHHIDGKLYHCRPGTLLILSPYQIHQFDDSFPWNGYIASFQDSEIFPIDNIDANYAMTKAIRSVDVMTEVQDLVGREFEMLYEEYKKDSDLISGNLQRKFLQIILYKIFFRTNYHKQDHARSREFEDFQKFSDAVEYHYMSRHSVSQYTGDIHIPVKRLNNACKKVKGVSAKQIIDSRLLLEAKRLLGYTKKPISEIAIELGFNEPTNLAKFFRRHTEISPTEFRNMSKFFSENK